MSDKTIVLTEDDNIFDYLDGCVTTVVLALEAIAIGEEKCDLYLSNKNIETVLSLNKSHYYNDDLFDLSLNKALTDQDILAEKNIKCYRPNVREEFKEPSHLYDLSIMGVFKYDLSRSQ